MPDDTPLRFQHRYGRMPRYTFGGGYDESQHPRGKGGKWIAKGGSDREQTSTSGGIRAPRGLAAAHGRHAQGGQGSAGGGGHNSAAHEQAMRQVVERLRTDPGLQSRTGPHGDELLHQLMQARGADRPPQSISEATLQQRIDHGALDIWRGMNGDATHTGADFAEAFRHGENYAGSTSAGNANGTGIFAGVGAAGRETARQYASGGHSPVVLHMTLKPGARVVTEAALAEHVDRAQHDLMREMATAQQHGDRAALEHASKRFGLYLNTGRAAALLGYDAVLIPHTHQVQIVNRAMVQVSTTNHDPRNM